MCQKLASFTFNGRTGGRVIDGKVIEVILAEQVSYYLISIHTVPMTFFFFYINARLKTLMTSFVTND
jgi:hypothetical protein